MDSWIFRTARKVCVFAFGMNIFIHAVIGASMTGGLMKGALSMCVMLGLLVVFNAKDLDARIKRSRKKRKKDRDDE